MTETTPIDVGVRLLHLRKERGLSLRALAKECGLSVNAINRIERGESSPTVSSLRRLAHALNVQVVEFFKAQPEHSTILVREGARLRTRGDGVIIESLGTGLHGQTMGPFIMTLMPGASSAEEPITHGGEEFAFCLEGEVDFLVQGEWQRLAAGDSILFLASQEHLCRNSSQERARLVLVVQTSGEEVGSTQQRHIMTEVGEGEAGVEPDQRLDGEPQT
jgi:transcriptional regulator with XRE-family HTH domain